VQKKIVCFAARVDLRYLNRGAAQGWGYIPWSVTHVREQAGELGARERPPRPPRPPTPDCALPPSYDEVFPLLSDVARGKFFIDFLISILEVCRARRNLSANVMC